jgi:acetyltransferase
LAARLSQINYDREMALILTDIGAPAETEIYGVARIAADPNNERAEYAVIVRNDMTGKGLGTLLLKKILACAEQRGIREVFGDVLHANRKMLKLCEKLGFRIAANTDDPTVVRTSIKL